MKILNQVLVLVLVLVATSCGSSKKVARSVGEEVIYQYCGEDEYPSVKEAFRACASGESLDQAVAKKKAMNNCRTELASVVNTIVKTVSDNYVKSTEVNNQEQLHEQFQESSVNLVNQALTGAKPICTKLTKSADGHFHYYVTLELDSEDVLVGLNQGLSQEEVLKVDYDYQKFKKVYDAEMSKLN